MNKKSLIKGAGILAVLGLMIGAGMQGGAMMNLHGGEIVDAGAKLNIIEPAAGGGYDAEEPSINNAECVVKAGGVGSLTTCD